jgi:hypothetical protein
MEAADPDTGGKLGHGHVRAGVGDRADDLLAVEREVTPGLGFHLGAGLGMCLEGLNQRVHRHPHGGHEQGDEPARPRGPGLLVGEARRQEDGPDRKVDAQHECDEDERDLEGAKPLADCVKPLADGVTKSLHGRLSLGTGPPAREHLTSSSTIGVRSY